MKEDAASHLFFMLFFERLLFKLILLLITYIYIGEIDEFKINCTRFYCGSW